MPGVVLASLQQLVTERVLKLVASGNQHKDNTCRFIWTPDAEIVIAEPDWLKQLEIIVPNPTS